MSTTSPKRKGMYTAVTSENEEKETTDTTSQCSKCLKLHFRATPYKATVIRLGSKTKRRFTLIWSCILALCLLTIGVVFGFSDLNSNFIDFGESVDACIEPQQSVAIYVEKYRNITKWNALRFVGNHSVKLTNELNETATNRYKYRYNANG